MSNINKNKKVNNQYDNDFYEEDRSGYNKFVENEEDADLAEFNQLVDVDTELKPRDRIPQKSANLKNYTAPSEAFEEIKAGEHEDPFQQAYDRRISTREDDYHKKRYRALSPTRFDPLKDFDKAPDSNSRTYKDIMLEQKLSNERVEMLKKNTRKIPINQNNIMDFDGVKKQRLDNDNLSAHSGVSENSNITKMTKTHSDWDNLDKKENNIQSTSRTVKKWDSTPDPMNMTPRKRRWDLTSAGDDMTPRSKIIC